MPMIVTVFLSSVLVAVLNRFSGGGFGWKPTFRGRPIYYAFIAALVLLPFMYAGSPIIGALSAFSLLVWRIPGWYGAIDGGTDKGTRLRDGFVMFLRGLLLFPVFAYAAFMWKSVEPLALLAFTALMIAVFYDVANNYFKDRVDDPVAMAEVASGSLIGGVFSLVYLMHVAFQ